MTDDNIAAPAGPNDGTTDPSALDALEDSLSGMAKFNFGEELEEEARKLETAPKGPHPPVFDENGIRQPTPGWPELKVMIQLVDDTTMYQLVVTTDWTFKDVTQAVAFKTGVDWQFFQMQEFIPTRTPPTRWLRMEATVANEEDGVQPLTKLLFRMRWLKIPKGMESNQTLLIQFYHNIRKSFITENTPVHKRNAIKLAALQLQISQGNYDASRMATGFLSKVIGEYLNESVTQNRAVEKLEAAVVKLYSQHTGKTQQDAMQEYIRFATELSTFGATMFDLKGNRRAAILDDGIAVFFGRVDDFSYMNYKDIERFEIPTEEPNTLNIIYLQSPILRETVKLYLSHPASTVYTLAAGYMHLNAHAAAVPPVIFKPADLPNPDLYVHRPIRVDISRFRTRLEVFKYNLSKQFKLASRSMIPRISGQISAALNDSKPLDFFDLSSGELDEKGMQLLSTAIDSTFKFKTKVTLVEDLTLTKIDFSNTQIKDQPAAISALKVLLACPLQTKTILLRNIGVAKSAVQLADAIKTGRFIEAMDLSGNAGLGANASDLFRTLKTMTTKISMFGMAACGLRDSSAHDIFDLIHRNVDTLTVIDFSTSELGESGIKIIAPAFNNSQKLVEVNFSKCQLGTGGAIHLIKGLSTTSVNRLLLSDNEISSKFISTLTGIWGESKMQNLQCLDVSLNALSSSDVTNLFKNLPQPTYPLQEVILNANVLKGGIEKSIAKAVIPSRKLVRIGLRSCELPKGAVIAVCDAIKQNALRKVDLAYNEIKDKKAVAKLCEALTTSTTIENLNLAAIGLGVKESLQVTTALAENHSLRSLRLDSNKMNAAALAKLALAINNNHNLTALGLCDIEATPKEIVDFLAAIPADTAMRSMDMRSNKLMPITIQAHTTRLANVSIIIG
ncbi:NLR family CARD domain-containing protein 3 [Pelomyxa schiedti]|nr:NLR family CARD domain-containing protein 3 [Pelomyxa schiedti]